MEPYFWPSLLLILGLALVGLEVFVPSGGLLSVLAGCSVLASIGLAFADGFLTGTVMLLATSILVPVVIGSAFKWWPHTPLGKLVLAKRPESEAEVLPDTDEYHRDDMIGKSGVAQTDLLPSGDVRIEGRVYDAVSVGMPISRGQAVRVVSVQIQRIVVRPLAESEIARRESADDVLSTPLDSLGIEPFEDPPA
ncbi:MAG: NfeD family protein [Planctomycetota bacterium]